MQADLSETSERHRVLLPLLLLLVVPFGVSAQTPGTEEAPALQQVGETAHPPIDEMSGIVRSRWQDNMWWVHNDSGDEPRLFAVDSTGAEIGRAHV